MKTYNVVDLFCGMGGIATKGNYVDIQNLKHYYILLLIK